MSVDYVISEAHSLNDISMSDIAVSCNGVVFKDRYGNAADILARLAGGFDAAVNARVSELFAILHAAQEDKIKELEIRAERAERRRDLAEQCEDSMSRVCAQQGNEIRRLEGKL